MASFLVYSASLIYAFGTVWIKVFNSNISTYFLCCSILIAAWIFSSVHLFLESGSNLGRLFKKIKVLEFILVGTLGTGLAFYLIILGAHSHDDMLASYTGFLLQFDVVACIVLGYLILKERIKAYEWVTIIVSVIGALLLTIDFKDSGTSYSGIIEVTIGALLFGLSIVYTRSLVKEFSANEITWLKLTGALVFCLVLTPFKFQSADFEMVNQFDVWLIILFGLSNFYVAALLIARAAQKLPAWKIGTIQRTIPLFTLALAYFINEEKPSDFMHGAFITIGMILIVAAMTVLTFRKGRENEK